MEQALAYASSHFQPNWDNFEEAAFIYSAVRAVVYSLVWHSEPEYAAMSEAWVQFTTEGGWDRMDKCISSAPNTAWNSDSVLDRICLLWAGPYVLPNFPVVLDTLREKVRRLTPFIHIRRRD